MTVTLLLIYLMVGVIAGIMAGLLGIGGGLVIVPMLVYCFTMQDIGSTHLMHLALGTSMASIVFTSVSSFLAHHKKGAVDWGIVKRMSVGILMGTFAGAWLASWLSTGFLKGFFVIFLYYVAIQLILDKKPPASREFPGAAGMFSAGGIIGVISSLVGIGGGSLSVPFMMWCNMPVHNAIGTASAIGFPLAVAGTLGYLASGLTQVSLPTYTLGFVYLPALFGIVTASVMTAPLGAKLAHSLPVPKLKRIFALLLLVVATKMAWSIFR
jgi:uncharacterized membrane protein YfcA